MIAYSTLDTFDEKQRVHHSKDASKDNTIEKTYLGLIMQSFVGVYELDIYGYISLSNVKYIIFKHESKLNPVSVNP